MTSLPVIPRFRDVGASINDISGRPNLRPGLLYTCANLGRFDQSLADDVDRVAKDQMRLEYQLRTVVDTTGFRKRFIMSLAAATTQYVPELPYDLTREDVLGLQYCTIALRGEKYRQQAWAHVSFWEKCKMGAVLTFNPRGIEAATMTIVRKHIQTGAIADTMRIIDAEPTEIGELFNQVLADPQAYPLVLAGGRLLVDSSILILLLLLLLDVPFEHIETDLNMAFKQVAMRPAPQGLSAEIFEDFQTMYTEWASVIRAHIDAKHGGIVAYLHVRQTGASPASLQAVKHHLSADRKEASLIDVSVEEYSEKGPKDLYVAEKRM